MRPLLFCMAFLCIGTSAFNQQITPKRSVNSDYLVKSKKQRKAALILLGGGAALMVTSFLIPRGDLVHEGICIGYFCSDKYKNDGIKSGLFIAGAVTALGSIPLFIISRKNRRRAAISFKMENSVLPFQHDIAYVLYPALKVKFRF
jgi:hypothetical protein